MLLRSRAWHWRRKKPKLAFYNRRSYHEVNVDWLSDVDSWCNSGVASDGFVACLLVSMAVEAEAIDSVNEETRRSHRREAGGTPLLLGSAQRRGDTREKNKKQ